MSEGPWQFQFEVSVAFLLVSWFSLVFEPLGIPFGDHMLNQNDTEKISMSGSESMAAERESKAPLGVDGDDALINTPGMRAECGEKPISLNMRLKALERRMQGRLAEMEDRLTADGTCI